MKMKESIDYKIFQVFNLGIMWFIVLATLYPFYYIGIASFSSESAVILGKVTIWPVEFTMRAYEKVIENPSFWIGYKNSIIYTSFSTMIGLVMTVTCAYPLSKKGLPGKNFMMKAITFTMFFSGGMVPNYLLIRSLGWIDTIWAITVPGAISVWNMIIMRTYFQGLPESLEEAAVIDGLSPIGVLVKIVLPLSKPILATIGLFIAVNQWNNWFGPLIYMNSNIKYPITLFLRNIIEGAQMQAQSPTVTGDELANLPGETLKAAAILIVAVPIICVYPFVQKYFVKGMMIGSIKE